MEGVKEIVCDVCGQVCMREFMGQSERIDCDCERAQSSTLDAGGSLCPSCGAGEYEDELIIQHDGSLRCRLLCICGVAGPWAEPADCDEAWKLWNDMPRRATQNETK